MTNSDKKRTASEREQSDEVHTGGLAVQGERGTAGAGRTAEERPSTLAGVARGDEADAPPNVRPDPGVWRGRGTGIKDGDEKKR
jgi:hypothetical protein